MIWIACVFSFITGGIWGRTDYGEHITFARLIYALIFELAAYVVVSILIHAFSTEISGRICL